MWCEANLSRLSAHFDSGRGDALRSLKKQHRDDFESRIYRDTQRGHTAPTTCFFTSPCPASGAA